MSQTNKRWTQEEVDVIVRKIFHGLRSVPDRTVVAGSWRRGCDNIGDIDLVVLDIDIDKVRKWFKKYADSVIVRKYDGAIIGGFMDGIRVEFYVTTLDSFGATLQFATGSAQHNIRLRIKAKRMGLKLSDKGIFDRETGEKLGGKTEKEIYEILQEPYPRPHERNE